MLLWWEHRGWGVGKDQNAQNIPLVTSVLNLREPRFGKIFLFFYSPRWQIGVVNCMVPPHGIQQCSFAYSLFQGISSSMPGNSRGRGRGKSSFSFYTIIVYKLEKVAQRDCPPKYYNWSLAWKWSIRKKMASWRKKGREGKNIKHFFGWEPGYYYMGMYYAKDNLFAPPAASLFAGGKMIWWIVDVAIPL